MTEFEFHVSSRARRKYNFNQALFGLNGNVLLADFAAARSFAASMTRVLGRVIPSSEINALGLIDEILHFLLRIYERQNPNIFRNALGNLSPSIEKGLVKFTREFPPLVVYRSEMTEKEYLAGETGGRDNRQIVLEEMLLLHITNQNPAAEPYKDLFDETPLLQQGAYKTLIESFKLFLEHQPGFKNPQSPGQTETIIEVLTAPTRVAPQSLVAQLEYLLYRWGDILGEDFLQKILRALDFIREERIRFTGPGGSDEKASVPDFSGMRDYEYERFSQDKEWMPRLVLIAKNSHVWLDQLSQKYGRWIRTLDQIPNEELELLRQRGMTGLWLIGLWERSRASQKIKQLMGQSDAVASAYSLKDYQIAMELGGWEALQNLRLRAWQHGIRLSADMVPNHMGIDSRWVIEHPDWFLSIPYPPFPNYSFSGMDLSDDERVGIQIEDHYYDKTDAAVVFKRFDRWTGDSRFIYHGNDGTSMPWNDTAQLDYSKKEVREAVIQTILHIARNFPIIRFDAAMTLARRHIQRLWFPEPGAGGAIPSRSEHGMTQSEFNAAVPDEFWREVVDRIAAEVPDTLLLAEAFWLMEGYFVRTLGMHRVYNSAFMHMLRDEDNAKYRQVMKNTLEFDPQVLKRYVNFMNNPDEKTAAEQFGTTDKYFGICTLLVTLPGLPMFGHGQIEGYREKYGMEYQHAKWDEQINEGLVRGHEGRIFPLIHRRNLFAEVENFLLYDFFTPEGFVNEDVFAFSNHMGAERGLVIYHNKYSHTQGWVKTSSAFMEKSSGKLVQKNLSEGLGLPQEGFAIFKDYVSNLEYIRSCREITEKGLFLLMGEYQCHVFLDWHFTSDNNNRWSEIAIALNGAGTPSVQAKYDEIFTKEMELQKPSKIKPRKVLEKKKEKSNQKSVRPTTKKVHK